MLIEYSENIIISENIVYDNLGQGIILHQSKYNQISSNAQKGSWYYGLVIQGLSHNNTITGNNFTENTHATHAGDGIYIRESNGNNVTGNLLKDNDRGIHIADNSDENEIIDNTIHDNGEYGVLILRDTRMCIGNIVYGNNITNPLGINAYDNGTGTQWDYLGQGNYWGDYSSVDDNDDGIGDNPYYFYGTGTCVDNYPIWDDGLNPFPIIILNSPQPFSARTFGTTAPTINVTITDNDIVTAWYTLNYGSTKYDFKPEIGINIITIDQAAWSALDEGSVTIAFFANDTKGQESNLYIPFTKEIPSPSPGIPFGNYYIIFLGIGIVSILLVERKKRKK
jgi:parallel beta-helix repeat protein